MNRGHKVFSRVCEPVKFPPSCSSGPVKANDIFLHALFARITLTNNQVIEFQTKFCPDDNTIELYIPKNSEQLLDQLTGIQRGPVFIKFINWLIGSQTLVVQTDQTKDATFVPSSELQVWFGATSSVADQNRLVLELPTKEGSVVGHNLKTSANFSGSMQVFLVWTFICGSNTSFDIKTLATVSDALGGGPANYSNSVFISTVNLLPGDIRETELLNVPVVNGSDIINLLFNRNYNGSPDPQTESIGVLGIRIKLNSV